MMMAVNIIMTENFYCYPIPFIQLICYLQSIAAFKLRRQQMKWQQNKNKLIPHGRNSIWGNSGMYT